MKSTSLETTKKLGNPFKFLDAYKKKEADHFFGRAAETAELLRALQKSYVVVLYGPSGSGKSSIINCGLLNKLNINEDKVFEIRRRNIGLIPTIAAALHKGIQKKKKDPFSEQFVEQFKDIITTIKESKLNIVAANEQVDELDRVMISQKTAYQNEEISKAEFRKQIVENGEAVTKIEETIAKHKAMKSTNEQEFKAFFKQFISYFNSPPVFIFDQFEELFTNGQPAEIDEFGIFLQLIYSNHFPIKTLLSLREEYFSKLSQLENYLPQILYRRCLVDNPSEETVKLILRKSFERFNINQLGEGKEQQETDRIEKIVRKLGDKDSQRNRFYLPFLQIYMYKLYELDYKKSYPNGLTESSSFNEYGYAFIELKETEINNFGDIKAILKRYIIDIDKSLQKELGRLTRGEEIGNTVIRFLREFAYSEHTKRRIKIKPYDFGENQNKYEIEEAKVLSGLRKTIGVNINNYQINTILTALIKRRLLKPTSDNYLELSHDILARVVNEFPIKESNTELLSARFNNYFASYKNNDYQESNYLDDSTIEVLKENRLIDYILANEQNERQEKKEYWEKSLKKSEEIRESELFEEQKKVKKFRRLYFLMLGALFIALIGLGLFGVEYFKNHHNKGIIEHQKEEGAMKGKVFEGTANAFNEVKVDRTEAIKTIEKSEGAYDSAFGRLLNNLNVPKPEWYKKMTEWLDLVGPESSLKKPTLIGDFKNDLYRNFNEFPFYSQEITMGDSSAAIISTKHVAIPNTADSINFYFLTAQKDLYQASLNYKKAGVVVNSLKIATNVAAFEPYLAEDSIVTLVYIKDGLLHQSRLTNKESQVIEFDCRLRDVKAIIHLNSDRFICNEGDSIVAFNLKDGLVKNKKNIKKMAGMIKDIQRQGSGNSYLVLGENGNIWHSQNSYQLKVKGVKEITGAESIRGIEGSVSGKYLVGTDKRLYVKQRNSNFNNYKVHDHDDAITSIDYLLKEDKSTKKRTELWLLGSEDRTVSFWINREEKKRLVGHTDKILDVAFLDKENGDYVMTASADGTIKIWNLTSMYRATVKVREANKIKQLKYDSINAKLYVGFTFRDYQNPQGYLVSFCDSLSEDCKKRYYQQIKSNRENKGHITSFALGIDSSLLAGGFENRIVSSTSSPNKIRIRRAGKGGGSYPTIHAIVTQDSTMAMATKSGLYYFPNYFKDPVTERREYQPFDTLKGQNFNSVAFHPTKPLILATAENSNIYLWNIEHKELTILSDHLDKVRDAEFSKDGNWIVSGSWDNTAILWHWEEEQYVKKENFLAHTNDIEDVEFYGNDLFLTASSDYTVRIFENKENKGFQPIPSLIRHDHKITAATFSGDGQYIYTGDAQGNIKKWAFREFECDIKKRLGIGEEDCE